MVSGGKRNGAGRPAGKGKYGSGSKIIRVPVEIIDSIQEFIGNKGVLEKEYPLFLNKVQAGFPSPADDHVDKMISLDRHLVKNPAATFFLKVTGDSMIEASILPGDLMIVDRSIEARHGKIVIASVNNELTVKRLYHKNGEIKLIPENKKYSPIIIENEAELKIWGVVTNVIHQV